MKYVFISHKFFGQTIVKHFGIGNRDSRQHMKDWINTLVANQVPFWSEYSDSIDDDTGLPA
jgi:1,2-phenylacetyl-CoA epoxidase catalytic subunit